MTPVYVSFDRYKQDEIIRSLIKIKDTGTLLNFLRNITIQLELIW